MPTVANAQHAHIAVKESIDAQIASARNAEDPVKQGRAILALVENASPEANMALANISNNGSYSMLVRSWAVAGRMQMATSMDELRALEGQSRSFPATRRTWTRAMARVARAGNSGDLLELVTRVPELRAELQPEIAALPAKSLLGAMLSSSSTQVRQQAASQLGTKGKGTSTLVASALRFDAKAGALPWGGGALYLPSVTWPKKDALAVANHLLRWMLWAEARGDTSGMRVAANNLMSGTIANAAGYSVGNRNAAYTTEYWLGIWTKKYGSKAMEKVLADVKAK